MANKASLRVVSDERDTSAALALVTEWSVSLMSDGKTENTIEHYTRDATRFLEWGSIEDVRTVKTSDIETYSVYLRDTWRSKSGNPMADKTRRESILSLRIFFRWLFERDEIDKDIGKAVKLPESSWQAQPTYPRPKYSNYLTPAMSAPKRERGTTR